MIATALELIEAGRTTRVALSPLTVFVDDGDGSARTLLRQVLGGPATMADEVTGEVTASDARLLDAAGAPLSSGGIIEHEPGNDTAQTCLQPPTTVQSLADEFPAYRDAFRRLLGDLGPRSVHAHDALMLVPGYRDAAFALALTPNDLRGTVTVFPDLGCELHPAVVGRLAVGLRRRAEEGGAQYLAATVNVGALQSLSPSEVVCCSFAASGQLHFARMDEMPDKRLLAMLHPAELWLSEGCAWVVNAATPDGVSPA